MEVGLGHDLDQRRATPVEVHDAAVSAMDPPALAEVHQLGGVLLEVDAMEADVSESPAATQRHVVLGDLIALRQVRIEVVLAVKQRPPRDLGLEREADREAELHGASVQYRQ